MAPDDSRAMLAHFKGAWTFRSIVELAFQDRMRGHDRGGSVKLRVICIGLNYEKNSIDTWA